MMGAAICSFVLFACSLLMLGMAKTAFQETTAAVLFSASLICASISGVGTQLAKRLDKIGKTIAEKDKAPEATAADLPPTPRDLAKGDGLQLGAGEMAAVPDSAPPEGRPDGDAVSARLKRALRSR
jgi:hypothetical protein